MGGIGRGRGQGQGANSTGSNQCYEAASPVCWAPARGPKSPFPAPSAVAGQTFTHSWLCAGAHARPSTRLRHELVLRLPRLDRIVDRILAPFEAAAVMDGGPLPTH